jgi:hypothetical protein
MKMIKRVGGIKISRFQKEFVIENGMTPEPGNLVRD